jgi:cysteine desulfurase / selenocysteine lyase
MTATAPGATRRGTALAPRSDFPVLTEATYLNTASIGLVPLPVQYAAAAFDREIAVRGTTWFDEAQETEVLDRPRRAAATLINADPDNVGILSSASTALCEIAWWLRPKAGENVVAVDIDFPSDTYPWFRVAQDTGAEVRLVRVADDPAALTEERIAELVDDRTAAIAVSHIQYATGSRLDLQTLSDLAHAHRALLVVDATQSAGMAPIDVAAADVDFLVAGGYKWLCGAFGAGFMYVGNGHLAAFDPPLVGWRTATNPFQMDATRMSIPVSARRVEFSTMSYTAAVVLGRSIEYLLDLGIDAILEHDLGLGSRLMAGLDSLGATVITPRADASRAGIVTARFPGRDGEMVAASLNQEGIVVSPRAGSTRFSLHLFNDARDVDEALAVLDRVLND